MAWAGVIVVINVFFWLFVHYLQEESKRLGLTEHTNKTFYEPTVNVLTLFSLFSLLIIGDLLGWWDWVL